MVISSMQPTPARRGLKESVATAIVLCLGWIQVAYAQSYNEMMSESSAREFYADVQRRISAATHDGPTYYLSGYDSLTPEQEQYLEERRQNDEKLNELRKDPVLMRHVNGYWEQYQARVVRPRFRRRLGALF